MELGVTFIDTADSYRKDETDKHYNEQLIRKALQTYNGDISNVIVAIQSLATSGGIRRGTGIL